MAAPTRLPDHVDRYISSLPRMYSEQEHGAAIQRMAVEITRRAHARYSSQLSGAMLAAWLMGLALGFGLAGLL